MGAWSFHKRGNGGFTQVLARAAQALGAEIRLDSAVDHVITWDGRATGVALADGTEFYAPVVVSALDPRRTFIELVEPRELPTDLVENIRRFRFQGTSAKVNFALDGAAEVPGARRSDRPVPRLHQHRPLDGVPRARLRRRASTAGTRSGRTSTTAIQSDGRSGHGAAGQGGHELLHPVRAVPPARERLGHREGAPRRHGPGHARVVLPGLRRPRPAARGAYAARHRAHGRPLRGQHLRRRVPGARRCSSSARPRAGRSTGPRSTATTSAARAPTRAAA